MDITVIPHVRDCSNSSHNEIYFILDTDQHQDNQSNNDNVLDNTYSSVNQPINNNVLDNTYSLDNQPINNNVLDNTYSSVIIIEHAEMKEDEDSAEPFETDDEDDGTSEKNTSDNNNITASTSKEQIIIKAEEESDLETGKKMAKPKKSVTFNNDVQVVRTKRDPEPSCLSRPKGKILCTLGILLLLLIALAGVVTMEVYGVTHIGLKEKLDEIPPLIGLTAAMTNCEDLCQLSFKEDDPSILDYGKSILISYLGSYKPRTVEKLCCLDIGCFTREFPFDVLPLPVCITDSMVMFRLYSRHTPSSGTELQFEGKIPQEFKPDEQTIVIVHGFKSKSSSEWVLSLSKVLLSEHPQVNIITVNWQHYASRYFYSQSASNTRSVGRYTAIMLENLVQKSNFDRIWCIGHSLGAHTCGYIGRNVFEHTGHKIGRITGLDPAGPCFECQPSVDVGLNPSCAQLVEALHTDTRLGFVQFGTRRPLGHIDYYPNGLGNQPGCRTRKRRDIVNLSWNEPHDQATNQYFNVNPLPTSNQTSHQQQGLNGTKQYINETRQHIDRMKENLVVVNRHKRFNDIAMAISCSHSRATNLMIEAIEHPGSCVSQFVCKSVDDMPDSCEPCAPHCALLGFQRPTKDMHGIFFLITDSQSSFCLG